MAQPWLLATFRKLRPNPARHLSPRRQPPARSSAPLAGRSETSRRQKPRRRIAQTLGRVDRRRPRLLRSAHARDRGHWSSIRCYVSMRSVTGCWLGWSCRIMCTYCFSLRAGGASRRLWHRGKNLPPGKSATTCGMSLTKRSAFAATLPPGTASIGIAMCGTCDISDQSLSTFI